MEGGAAAKPDVKAPAAEPDSRAEAVRVVTRVRPLNKSEREEGKKEILKCEGNTITIMQLDPKQEKPAISKEKDDDKRTFTFDAVYDTNSTQQLIFEKTARPIVDSVLEGYNGDRPFVCGLVVCSSSLYLWTFFASAFNSCVHDQSLSGIACSSHIRPPTGSIS